MTRLLKIYVRNKSGCQSHNYIAHIYDIENSNERSMQFTRADGQRNYRQKLRIQNGKQCSKTLIKRYGKFLWWFHFLVD